MKLIALTGPKHCGKSSTCRALQEVLPAVCRDVDEEMEKRTGKSPRSLFKEGADVFKAAEADALAALLCECDGSDADGRMAVIACGGGMVDNEAAVQLLKNRADTHIVYLETSAETAWKRIVRAARDGGGFPPFLAGGDGEEIHRALHARRGAAYKDLASLVIDCEGKSEKEIALEIKRFFPA